MDFSDTHMKIGCPPNLLSMIRSFHDDMKATIQYEDSMSEPFNIKSGVKQGCVFSPTPFGTFFSLLLKHSFGTSTEGAHESTSSPTCGSTITNNLSLDAELNKRIGKAATTLGRLATRVSENSNLTTKTKMAVYNACVISTILYGSEALTTYSKQERKLNSFHLRSLRCILGISWRNKVHYYLGG